MKPQKADVAQQLSVIDPALLVDSTGFLLRLSQIEAFKHFQDEMAYLSISPAEASVMVLVGMNPGIQQGIVAKRLKIKTAQMAKLASALEKRTILQRIPSPVDGRAVNLFIASKGTEMLALFPASFAEIERRTTRYLDAGEKEQLASLLKKMLRINKRF